ncbi:MAG: FHA domain-containing protein [Myxococcales bacterium FL481]|nr:MAG: FHA domain-containing protein [Myxococcales bacterium FL481]
MGATTGLGCSVGPSPPLSVRHPVCDTAWQMSAYQLEIHRRDRPVETREFTVERVSIGRDSGDLALHDPEVSSRHGELVFTGSELTYVDLNSTNGTFDATGARIRDPKVLAVGAALRMGKTTVLLTRIGGPPRAADPPVSETIFAPGGLPAPAPTPPGGSAARNSSERGPTAPGGRLPPPGVAGMPRPGQLDREPAGSSGMPRPGQLDRGRAGGMPRPGQLDRAPAGSGDMPRPGQRASEPVGDLSASATDAMQNPAPAFPALTTGDGQAVRPSAPGRLPPPSLVAGASPSRPASGSAAVEPTTGEIGRFSPPVAEAFRKPAEGPDAGSPTAAAFEPSASAKLADEFHVSTLGRSEAEPPGSAGPSPSGGFGPGRLPPPQRGGRPTGTHAAVDADPHAADVGLPPSGADVGVVEQPEAAFAPTGTLRSLTHAAIDEPPDSDGTGSSEGLAQELRRGWEFLAPVLTVALAPLGALLVGGAIARLLLGWVPVVGSLLGFIFAGIQLVVGPLALGVLFYVLIKARLGQRVELREAWMTVYRRADSVWINLFVASFVAGIATFCLVIPGIALGFFVGPVFFLEDRRRVEINSGALQLFKRRAPQILLLCLGVGVVTLAAYIPVVVMAGAGLVGGILARVFDIAAALLLTLATGLLAAISVQMYFRLRGRDALELAEAKLVAFEGAANTISPANDVSPPA